MSAERIQNTEGAGGAGQKIDRRTRGLYGTTIQKAKDIRAAAAALEEQNTAKTFQHLVAYLGIDESTVTAVFSKIKGLKQEIGVIDQNEFEEHQYRVIANTFHDLGLDVTDVAFANILRKSVYAVRLFFKRHESLKNELRVVMTQFGRNVEDTQEHISDVGAPKRKRGGSEKSAGDKLKKVMQNYPPDRARTVELVADFLERPAHSIHRIFRKNPGLKEELGILNDNEFQAFKYHVFANLLKDLGIAPSAMDMREIMVALNVVGDEDNEILRDKADQAARNFLYRHKDILAQKETILVEELFNQKGEFVLPSNVKLGKTEFLLRTRSGQFVTDEVLSDTPLRIGFRGTHWRKDGTKAEYAADIINDANVATATLLCTLRTDEGLMKWLQAENVVNLELAEQSDWVQKSHWDISTRKDDAVDEGSLQESVA